MAKVPVKNIKVAPFVWSVSHDPDLLGLFGGDAASQPTRLRIIVDDSQSAEFLKDSLLHEVLHAIWSQTSLFENSEEAKAIEERTVATLAPRVLAFLKDNPKLVFWLMGVDGTETNTGKRKKPVREENADGIQEG